MATEENLSQVIDLPASALLPGTYEISEQALMVLDEELSANSSPEETFVQLGRDGLVKVLEQRDPELLQALTEGHQKLDNAPGFFIVKGTGLERVEQSLAQLGSITLSCVFGTPTQTTPRSPVIAWPVAYKPESKNAFKTFSETTSEASFHTDSQYMESPEHYFGLFCITPDQFGGGVSQLVNGAAVLEQVEATNGPHFLSELMKPYPFRLPSIFTRESGDQVAEVIWAPIVKDDGIRYRHDTLINALNLDGVEVSDTQLAAVDAFEKALDEVDVCEYSLEAGDVMFINNHTMLHGRTAFHDEQRLLYRVRMN